MIKAAELAGFFSAHAIWSVFDGDCLIPMLAYTTESGERCMKRLVHGDAQAAVAHGREKLYANTMNANEAALVYDGRITLTSGKCDALILEIRSYFSPDSEAIVAVPYTPKSSGTFAVHKPKLLVWKNCDDLEVQVAFNAFFKGIAAHEMGAKIWNDSLNESR